MRGSKIMHKLAMLGVVATMLLCLFSVLAYAADTKEAKTVTSELKAFIVTHDKDGKEVLTPAKEGHPGDLIEYQLILTNKMDDKVKSLQATLPIPEGSAYQDKTTDPATVQASLDGKTFAPVPLTRKVKNKDGKEVTETIPCSEYRALRWDIPEIESGKAVTMKARVKIEEVATK